MLLRGNMYITSDKNIIYETLNMRPDVKVINLDEDNSLNIDKNTIIQGTILLPPVEAKIAEVDGNEQKYDMIYVNHLTSDKIADYMSSIMAFSYMGGSILFYLPDEYNNTKYKLLGFLYNLYGIHVGVINDKTQNNAMYYSDINCEPMQLNMIFQNTGIMSWREYLLRYPINMEIPESILYILINVINPYGKEYKDKIREIIRLQKRIKEKPNVKPVIESSQLGGNNYALLR